LRRGVGLLEQLVAATARADGSGVKSTVELESLLGSAYKRLANVVGSKDAARAALAKALEHYREAERIARERRVDNLFYPALNCMSLELRLHDSDDDAPIKLGRERLDAVRQSLIDKNRDDPDFWSVVGAIELMVYEALAKRELAGAVSAAIDALADLRRRVKSARQWDSVTFQMHVTLDAYASTSRLAKGEHDAANKLLAQFPAHAKHERKKPKTKKKPRRAKRRSGPRKRGKRSR
jgi:hypothetical protein